VRTLYIAALLAFLIACGASSSGGVPSSANANTSLSVSATTRTTGTAPSAATSLDLGNGISLERVRIAVRKLKLEGDGKTAADGHHGEGEPVLGPFVIDLSAAALAGGISEVVDGLVPQGTFHEMKLVIGPLSAGESGDDPSVAEMAAQSASIIVDGTIDDAAFTFVSSLAAEVQQEGDAVEIGANGNNITLTIDPTAWFGGTGARLDPRDVANEVAIEANIEASLAVFEDDDKSGHDDRGEHGGGSHGGDGGGEKQGGDQGGGKPGEGQGGAKPGEGQGGAKPGEGQGGAKQGDGHASESHGGDGGDSHRDDHAGDGHAGQAPTHG
jgi:hypothetical protein